MKISKDGLKVLAGDFEEVRTDYSGRGMFGAKCLAVVTEDTGFQVGIILKKLAMSHKELLALIDTKPEQDSLGMDYVYYWPTITASN